MCTRIPDLFVIFRGWAEDGELRAAGLGLGGFAGVEERLDKRLQMLPFLTKETHHLETLRKHFTVAKRPHNPMHAHTHTYTHTSSAFLTSFISLLGTDLMIFPVNINTLSQ